MHISYVKIQNFRNFHCLEVNLSNNVVIVGENTAGKSNFLYALRLVLDSSLSDRKRQLTSEDFWAGKREVVPIYKGTVIEIIIGITDLDKELLCFLHDCTILEKERKIAYIAYRFEPDPKKSDTSKPSSSQYTFNFYKRTKSSCDEDWKPITKLTEIRKRLVFQVIPALRDIEGSIESWRRSPLKNLVEGMKLEGESKFQEAVSKLEEASKSLREAKPVEELESDIQTQLQKMLRGIHKVDPRLNFVTLDQSTLSRSLRLFVDGDEWRSIGSASLGITNVLHLVLLTLDSRERRAENEFVILAVEEPEAHLHPHLQRLVFRYYFELAQKVNQQTFITTHSPHITSVSPLDSIVLIKMNGNKSYAQSTAGSLNDFSSKEKKDISRYLDVTKHEMLFSKGVILVEGVTELFLLPEFVKHVQNLTERDDGVPVSFDQFSITICDVRGTGFKPYVKLLKTLSIPVVVLTDGDRYIDKQGNYKYPGFKRGIEIAECLKKDSRIELEKLLCQSAFDKLGEELANVGVFVNEQTLEAELLLAGNQAIFLEIFKELNITANLQTKLETWMNTYINAGDKGGDDANNALNELLKRIEKHPCYGKGRFAQAFINKVDRAKVPDYLSQAIRYIVKSVQ